MSGCAASKQCAGVHASAWFAKARRVFRDPAVWAWLAVGLLALLPLF